MKAVVVAVMTYLMAAGAYAACANTVAESKGNGVYRHLLAMSGGQTWLQLERESDGAEVGVGIEGGKFKLQVRGVKVSVKVCTKGTNGIVASVGNLTGEVTKVGNGVYDVIAPYSYSGRYIVK